MRQAELDSRYQQDQREKEDKSRREADQKRRLAEAASEREKEEHRLNMKIAIDKLRESEIGRKIIELIGEEELYKYDPDSLNSLHIDAVIKHSREQKEKLKIQYKKVDFLIRAQHEAEIPLIRKQSEMELNRRYEIQLAERERAIERRVHLFRMTNDQNEFLQSIRGQRHRDFILQMKDFEKRLVIARQQRLEQLRREHVEKKKQEWRKRKELEKQVKIEAERKRQEAERLALARAEAEERKRKFDEQTRKQRERDEEIDRKIQEQKEATRSSSNMQRRPPSHYLEKDKTAGFVSSNFKFLFIKNNFDRLWRRSNRENDDDQR